MKNFFIAYVILLHLAIAAYAVRVLSMPEPITLTPPLNDWATHTLRDNAGRAVGSIRLDDDGGIGEIQIGSPGTALSLSLSKPSAEGPVLAAVAALSDISQPRTAEDPPVATFDTDLDGIPERRVRTIGALTQTERLTTESSLARAFEVDGETLIHTYYDAEERLRFRLTHSRDYTGQARAERIDTEGNIIETWTLPAQGIGGLGLIETIRNPSLFDEGFPIRSESPQTPQTDPSPR